MTDVGMGGNLPKALQTNKVNENAQVDKKEALKNREAMAGSKQVEGKYKKEDVKRTNERYKAFKSAYQYLLGDEPEDEIDEEMGSNPLEEEEELKKDLKVKPNLKEIEEYKSRDRFKAKMGLLLGDDFDENAPLDNDEDLGLEERKEDTKNRLELAQEAYNGLIQYISDSLGKFDFDSIEDCLLLLNYDLPEDAIIKFIMLQQLSRASSDFPSTMDMSVMMHKFKKLGINLSADSVHEIISADYGTEKRLKYTVSGFIYIPLLEVLTKIEDDLKKDFLIVFTELLDELAIKPFRNLKVPFPEDAMKAMRDELTSVNNNIKNLENSKNELEASIKHINIKIREAAIEKYNILKNELKECYLDLEYVEKIITKIVFIYSFINSGLNISEFNKLYPLNVMIDTLSILGVRYKKPQIAEFLKEKVSLHALDDQPVKAKDELKKNTELSDNKIKNSVMLISKQPIPKQQQILKNMKINSFDLNTNFYWLKQKRLNEVIETSDILSNLFNR